MSNGMNSSALFMGFENGRDGKENRNPFSIQDYPDLYYSYNEGYNDGYMDFENSLICEEYDA